jgi:alpha-D-ribose 1-methylphosphonate 5-triphosphate synthase subunit PhnH
MASQWVFRLALSALYKPATPIEAEVSPRFASPPPLAPLLAALTLTLADQLVTVWLSPALRSAQPWLTFHCSPVYTEDAGEATLVLAGSLDELPKLADLNQGSIRYPDRSATVLLFSHEELNVKDLKGAKSSKNPETNEKPGKPGKHEKHEALEALPLEAFGPGLKDPIVWTNHGLSTKFICQWQDNHAAFPLGIDVFLVQMGSLTGLPRTLNLKVSQGSS